MNFFITQIFNEYNEIFLCKTSQRTSLLSSGAQFIIDMIDGHSKTCYDLFRMEINIFEHL